MDGAASSERFPWESVPRYLLRDRDRIFGEEFVSQVKAMESNSYYRAPLPMATGLCELLIGSIRRECLDHVVVFSESSLRRTLSAYRGYYHNWRTHLSLGKAPRKHGEFRLFLRAT